LDTQKHRHSKRFFDVEENVEKYIEMYEGMDERFLIDVLKKHLKPNSTVLELGMGQGRDLDILNETFRATGSDYSQIFLDIYRKNNPNSNLLLLNAETLETNKRFDAIFSNKVLHHLSKENLQKSIVRQQQLLNKNGILFHTFWEGSELTKFQDLSFQKYRKEEIVKMFSNDYEVLEIESYEEMIENDSIYTVLKIS